jgi:hypothetical protein
LLEVAEVALETVMSKAAVEVAELLAQLLEMVIQTEEEKTQTVLEKAEHNQLAELEALQELQETVQLYKEEMVKKYRDLT